MSRTYRHSDYSNDSYDEDHRTPVKRALGRRAEKPFRCTHCKAMVGSILYGGKHRNHCPYCLYSRHVDGRVPGDRAGTCGGGMAPVGAFLRRNGEHVVVHRCLTCRFERYNRIAADDDFELVLSLPLVEAKPSRPEAPAAMEELSA